MILSRSRPTAVWLFALATVATVLVIYAGTLFYPFVFDDHASILENPTIRSWSPPWAPFFPPSGGYTVSARPLLNATFAVNHTISGLEPWSYRAGNVILHVLAGLLLFSFLRRLPWTPPRRGTTAEGAAGQVAVAGAVTLLWVAHPLGTAVVTYTAQRAELLCSVFILLGLTAFIRMFGSRRPTVWSAICVAASVGAQASKEVGAVLPLLVLLCDRCFISGSWSEALRRRHRFHLALVATWSVTVGLLFANELRGGTVAAAAGPSAFHYLLTQAEAIVGYVGLVVWPVGLVFDHGIRVVTSPLAVLPELVILVGAVLGAAWLLWRQPRLGFAAAAFFLLLAPSSSFVPIASQTIADHRMYLAAVVPLVLLVFLVQRFTGTRGVIALSGLVLVLAPLSIRRNQTYRSEVALWQDTAAKAPDNVRAWQNLGSAWVDAGDLSAAREAFRRAAVLAPGSSEILASACLVATRQGQLNEAVDLGRKAVAADPDSISARLNLTAALLAGNNYQEAHRHARAAYTLQPQARDVRASLRAAILPLARASAGAGQLTEAARLVDELLVFDPSDAAALFLAGNLAAAQGDYAAALQRFRSAHAAAPGDLPIRNNLANVLLITGRMDEAVRHYEAILQHRPDDQQVMENLAEARRQQSGGR